MLHRREKTWVEIRRDCIIHNLNQFKRLVGTEVKLLAVVKANAYGHGLLTVGKIAVAGAADWLGVDVLDEALALRAAGIKNPILILGYTLQSRLPEAVKAELSLTVYNRATIIALGKIFQRSLSQNLPRTVNVHLKVETGTTRQGVPAEDVLNFARLIKRYPQLNLEGLSTHYANIEDTADYSYARKQLGIFRRVVGELEEAGINVPLAHTANSAATILFPETYYNLARVGIGLYGLWPAEEIKRAIEQKCRRANKLKNFSLRPALTWKTCVAQVKKIRRGTPVSYGLTEKVRCDSTIAVLPVGYGDGYDRRLSRVGEVLIAGRRRKVLGRICMNMMMVDVTSAPAVALEEEVVLLGRQRQEEITAEEIAQKIGTINYEVVTRINPLIKRVIV